MEHFPSLHILYLHKNLPCNMHWCKRLWYTRTCFAICTDAKGSRMGTYKMYYDAKFIHSKEFKNDRGIPHCTVEWPIPYQIWQRNSKQSIDCCKEKQLWICKHKICKLFNASAMYRVHQRLKITMKPTSLLDPADYDSNEVPGQAKHNSCNFILTQIKKHDQSLLATFQIHHI